MHRIVAWLAGLGPRTRAILAAIVAGLLFLVALFRRGKRAGRAEATAEVSRVRADRVAEEVAAAAKRGDDGAVQAMLEAEIERARRRRAGK